VLKQVPYGATAMTDVTFSVRIPAETKILLDALSKSTKRSKNFLARAAITSFVRSEADIVEGMEQGLADIRLGKTIPHADVARKSRRIIAAAFKRKGKRA
jgi:predicted transcriptional regulator